MNKMSYKVTDVEKLQSGGYRVGIEIKNNNIEDMQENMKDA